MDISSEATVVLVQCGGPSPVINASLAGAIRTWQQVACGGRLWGARHGMQGLVTGDFVELGGVSASDLQTLEVQPGAALGSGRYGFAPEHLPQTLESLARHGASCIILMGGNGTMGAAHLLAQERALRVIGVPKTIDNDIACTDVTPGYGSAARFVAHAARDAGLDLRAMATFDDVVVVEVMGRHVGWPAAAALLARSKPDDPPHLILVPEAPVDEERLLARIREVHDSEGFCLVVAAEGVCDVDGVYLAEKLGGAKRDARGQRVLSLSAGVAAWLARLVQERLELRCRQVRPDTILRSTSMGAATVDRALAGLVGLRAMYLVLAGETDKMVGLRIQDGTWQTQEVALSEVVGLTRGLPAGVVRAGEFDVAWELRDYLLAATGALDFGAPLLWSEDRLAVK